MLIRNVSDTARWVAVYRAMESARKDALFRDPLAARLAGDRGFEIERRMKSRPWAFMSRTVAFDELILRCVADGADTVVNLAAGMDARPYRMALPAQLRWIEADLPEILEEKERLLADEAPRCRVERVALDLADAAARRGFLAQVGGSAATTLVVSEGLVIYLESAQVAALSRDLAATPSVRWWVVDLASPALLRMLERSYRKHLAPVGVAFRFAPEEGPRFFEAQGWRVAHVESILKTARRIGRLPFPMTLAALFPDSKGTKPTQPWGGTLLLERRP